ncbi:hydroxyacid oxidase 1 [Trichonephila clavipes]|nr:hydroxyacid oxidase 1 [Trichonephila clavipes]
MILSSMASTLIEDVGQAAQHTNITLWMQTYIFDNRTWTLELVRRAERAGFKGVVVTADAPVDGTITCDGRQSVGESDGELIVNLDITQRKLSPSATFKDIAWLRSFTKLPIIVKGILSGMQF